jgi:hypothetical protein
LIFRPHKYSLFEIKYRDLLVLKKWNQKKNTDRTLDFVGNWYSRNLEKVNWNRNLILGIWNLGVVIKTFQTGYTDQFEIKIILLNKNMTFWIIFGYFAASFTDTMFLNISCGIVWTVPTGPRVGFNMLQATGKASQGSSHLSSFLESSIQGLLFFIYLNQINSGDFALVPQKFWHRDTFVHRSI